ncbi:MULTISPECIES: CHAD domain-containing protein [unclassified Isoptericola]|uniref:CHAD domain-containing protein n=1 Tax=unclassified Isoptericola TaxID=2623355 RepID=UPI0036614BB0
MARTAGEVLTDAIRTQAETILRGHDDVRLAASGPDAPEAVHDARVAVRRLRGTLRAFRPCLDPEDGTLDALTWWVRTLGAARDAEVRRAGLAALAADLTTDPPGADPEVHAGLVLLDGALRAAHEDARGGVAEALASPRCRDLTSRLDALAVAPHAVLGPRAGDPGADAATALRPGVEHELARVRRRAAPVASWAGPDDGPRPAPEAVHRLRKAARRARYAAEVLGTSGDAGTDRWAAAVVDRHRALQDLLGTVHDADVLRASLVGLSGPRTAAAVTACTALGDERAARALEAAADLAR